MVVGTVLCTKAAWACVCTVTVVTLVAEGIPDVSREIGIRERDAHSREACQCSTDILRHALSIDDRQLRSVVMV